MAKTEHLLRTAGVMGLALLAAALLAMSAGAAPRAFSIIEPLGARCVFRALGAGIGYTPEVGIG